MIRTQLLTVVSLVVLMPALAADVTFTDGTFYPGDWSVTKTGDGVAVASQDLLGGNPGEFRRAQNQPDIGLTVFGWHFSAQFVYDPAVHGAIDSVSWSVDFQNLNSGQSLALAIVQDDIRYSPASSSVVTTFLGAGWVNHATSGLVESDFGTPDFSKAGSPITFGFVVVNTYDPVAGNISYVVGYDNLGINVVSVPAAVPAMSPIGLGLLVSLLVGAAILVLRR